MPSLGISLKGEKMKGEAYLFRRRSGALGMGHVAWGFLFDPNEKIYCFGSTENTSGNPFVAPGDDNAAWVSTGSLQVMLQTIRDGEHGSPGYDDYKRNWVEPITPRKARKVGESKRDAGYKVVGLPGNNCADHAYDVFSAYGVTGLVSLQVLPGPNAWFDAHIFGWDYLGKL
jgi:hypothetical protein